MLPFFASGNEVNAPVPPSVEVDARQESIRLVAQQMATRENGWGRNRGWPKALSSHQMS